MSCTLHLFGYCPVAWYSNSGKRRYFASVGFVYKNAGQAGKMTSTVFTFYGSSVSDGAIGNEEVPTPSLDISFMNMRTSDELKLPLLPLETEISVAPNAWRMDKLTMAA